MHQLEDVALRILPSCYLDAVGDVAETLLEPGGAAGMRPQYPCLRRRLARAVGMLDGKLRLALRLSVCRAGWVSRVDGGMQAAHPTPPSPTRAILASACAHLSQISSSSVPRSTKSASRANGITIDGCGGVSGRSGPRLSLAPTRARGSSDPPRLTTREVE